MKMFSNCWHRTVHVFTLTAALFFAQSANAAPPQCTLTASPAVISAGSSSTLTASCSPIATYFEWSGGTCTSTSGSTCTVTPSMTTRYSAIGIGVDGTSTVASTVVFTGGPFDGIYQWDAGYYLSVHEIGGDTLIGTIYWVYTGNPVQAGTRTVPEADTFDLFHGQIVGSSATMTGSRFYRGCTLSYDFTFNNDSSLKVHLNSVSNSSGVSLSDVDCTARYSSEVPDRTIPEIF